MSTENSIDKIMQKNGYDPIEHKGIIVKYAPDHSFGSKFASFFTLEYYVLQLCKEEIVMIPIRPLNTGGVKDHIALQLPYSAIQSVNITEDKMDYQVSLVTSTDTICLLAQKKEWSEFRSSGTLATGMSFLDAGIMGAATSGFKALNWHRQNLDGTLDMLQALSAS